VLDQARGQVDALGAQVPCGGGKTGAHSRLQVEHRECELSNGLGVGLVWLESI
jgi:hypothetical protein